MMMTPISTTSDFAMFAEVEVVATKPIAVHHHRPPLLSDFLVPAMVRVHVGARRNQFSTFHGRAGAVINSCPFRVQPGPNNVEPPPSITSPYRRCPNEGKYYSFKSVIFAFLN